MFVQAKKVGAKNVCSKSILETPINLHQNMAGVALSLSLDERNNDYISFDGVQAYIEVPTGQPLGELSVAIEFEVSRHLEPAEFRLFGSAGNSMVRTYGSESWSITASGGGFYCTIKTTEITLNTTHTIRITAKQNGASATITLWLDNDKKAERTFVMTLNHSEIAGYLGKFFSGYFPGKIYSFALWGEAKTLDEMKSLDKTGLEYYFNFAGTTTTVKNLIENNPAGINHGAVHHQTAIDQSKHEGGMSFDPVDDYVEIGDVFASILTQTGHFTVATVLNPRALSSRRNIWCNNGSGSNRLFVSLSGTWVGFARYDGSAYTRRRIQGINLNKNNNLIARNDGGTITFRLNGVEATNNGDLYTQVHSNNKLILGYNGNTNGNKGLDGDIKQFIIWDRALSDQELEDWENGKYVAGAKLAYNFLRKNNDNTTVYDCSGNGHNATNNGAVYIDQKNHGDIIGNVKRVNLGGLRALEFGDNSYMLAPFKQSGATPFYLSVVLTQDSIHTSGDWAETQTIFGNWRSTSGNATIFCHLRSSSVSFRAYGGDFNDSTASVPQELGTHLYHFVFDPETKSKLIYKNGELVKTTAHTTWDTDPLLFEKLRVGGTRSASFTVGKLANIQAVQGLPTPQEIRNQYLMLKSNCI